MTPRFLTVLNGLLAASVGQGAAESTAGAQQELSKHKHGAHIEKCRHMFHFALAR